MTVLDVPGARLRYDVRGSGPVIALIGLPMTAAGFEQLAEQLEGDRTVVTYDPRGFDRSSVVDPGETVEPALAAEDVRRVLAAVTDEPAAILGSSGGAVTGLALVERHAEVVSVLVAHEPPVVALLPDSAEIMAGFRNAYDTMLAQGPGAAFAKFMAVAGFTMPAPDPSAPPHVPSEQEQRDGARFLTRSMLPVSGYEPDLAALRAASTRIVVAGGERSDGQLARRTADALAGELGHPLAEFPGDHTGFASDAVAFAGVLRTVLAG